MKKAVFIFCVLLSCSSLPLYGQSLIKIMTYNIYHGEDPEEGDSNLEDIAELIREEQPDLVALQEVDSLTGRSASLNNGIPQNIVKVLANMTGMYGYFGKAINFDGGGYGEGILSRTPVETRNVMLPIPKGGEKRALLIAETKTPKGGKLLFAGTHLCHQYPQNRLAQVEKINMVFEQNEVPVVLAGDLNFTPGSKPYKALQTHWIDAARQVGETVATYSYQNPTRRIDYLFLSKEAQKLFEILEVRVVPVDYSDHMPVMMTLKMRD